MESDSILSVIILAISLAGFGLGSLAEASIASVRRERVQALVAQGTPGAEALERLFALPGGNTGCLTFLRFITVSASVVSATALVVSLIGVSWPFITLAVAGAVVVMALEHSTAQGAAAAYGESISLKSGPWVRGLAAVVGPALVVQEALSRRLFRAAGQRLNGGQDVMTVDIPVSSDTDGGPLDEREARMIRGVVQLDNTMAREIMVPRVDIVAAEIATPLPELAELMVSGGHSRVPIYGDSMDDVKGVVHARDVLSHMVKDTVDADTTWEGIIRPALFIPESKTLEELLNEFQERRVHMAIVVDEYGGVSGLVTIEDLLEEIVGEIMDEFDVGEAEIVPVNENEYMIDARVSIDDLNDLLRVSVESNGFDTLGGFVYQRLGRIPSPGDSVEYDGLTIEVMSTVGRRLKRLRVIRRVAEGQGQGQT